MLEMPWYSGFPMEYKVLWWEIYGHTSPHGLYFPRKSVISEILGHSVELSEVLETFHPHITEIKKLGCWFNVEWFKCNPGKISRKGKWQVSCLEKYIEHDILDEVPKFLLSKELQKELEGLPATLHMNPSFKSKSNINSQSTPGNFEEEKQDVIWTREGAEAMIKTIFKDGVNFEACRHAFKTIGREQHEEITKYVGRESGNALEVWKKVQREQEEKEFKVG
jgi:hypothetical protein